MPRRKRASCDHIARQARLRKRRERADPVKLQREREREAKRRGRPPPPPPPLPRASSRLTERKQQRPRKVYKSVGVVPKGRQDKERNAAPHSTGNSERRQEQQVYVCYYYSLLLL